MTGSIFENVDDTITGQLRRARAEVHGGWQIVNESDIGNSGQSNDRMERFRVPGGWIYRSIIDPYHDCNDRVTMVFVPEVKS
jgi:hypothetical protein